MLNGKNILVTGASSGIGKCIAIYFSQLGANVIITGRNIDRLNDTFSLLSSDNNFSIISDLSSVESIKSLMDDCYDKIGRLDGVVHCAGIQKTLPLKILKENHFDDVFNANVKSAQFISKFLSKKKRFNTAGTSLIFLSSVAATKGEPAISTYSASKAALEGLTKSLAIELARNKIRVNCIAPGHVETEMALEFSKQLTSDQYQHILKKHPLGLGKPEDIAHSAAFLMSNYASWITGSTMYVDGGYSAQ
jgi:NAD(P)-dependent dehydrogenase (short-subunit alcohol dehydrogenase family)